MLRIEWPYRLSAWKVVLNPDNQRFDFENFPVDVSRLILLDHRVCQDCRRLEVLSQSVLDSTETITTNSIERG